MWRIVNSITINTHASRYKTLRLCGARGASVAACTCIYRTREKLRWFSFINRAEQVLTCQRSQHSHSVRSQILKFQQKLLHICFCLWLTSIRTLLISTDVGSLIALTFKRLKHFILYNLHIITDHTTRLNSAEMSSGLTTGSKKMEQKLQIRKKKNKHVWVKNVCDV